MICYKTVQQWNRWTEYKKKNNSIKFSYSLGKKCCFWKRLFFRECQYPQRYSLSRSYININYIHTYIYNIHVYILAASCWINQITKALDIVSTTYGAYFSMSKAKKDMNPKYLYSECMKAPLRVIYIKSDGMS